MFTCMRPGLEQEECREGEHGNSCCANCSKTIIDLSNTSTESLIVKKYAGSEVRVESMILICVCIRLGILKALKSEDQHNS